MRKEKINYPNKSYRISEENIKKLEILKKDFPSYNLLFTNLIESYEQPINK